MNTNATITTVLIVGYIIGIILLALALEIRAKRKQANRTAEEYATAKGKLGLFTTFGLMVGNIIGGAYMVGNVSAVYEHGISWLWTYYAYWIGWTAIILLIPFYRAAAYKYGAASLGEVFKVFFSPRIQFCVSLMILLAFIGGLAAGVNVLVGILSPLLGLSKVTVTIIAIVLFTGIALLGGMEGIARVNLVHTIVMVISFVTILICCLSALDGGYGKVVDTLDPSVFSLFHGDRSMGYIVGTLLVQPFVCLVSAFSVVGTMGAKSTKVARNAQIMLSVWVAVFFISLIIIATCGMYLWPELEPASAWYSIAAKFGPVVAALASCGVLASSLSTYPGMIMMISSNLVNEIFPVVAKREIDEKKKLTVVRIGIVVSGICFNLLGLLSSDLVSIITNAYTVWASCGICLVLFLLWKRPSEKCMFAGMITGFIICVIWVAASFAMEGDLFGIPISYAAGIGTVVALVLSTLLTTKPGPSENYVKYKQSKIEMKAAIAAGETE